MNINYAKLAGFITDHVDDFKKSGLTLDQYCALNHECDFAIMDACLHLAQLSPLQIDKIGKAQVPPSCWYAFVQISDTSDAAFEEAIRIVSTHSSGVNDEPLVVKLRRIMDDGKADFPDAKDLRLAGPIGLKFSALDAKESGVFKNMAAYLTKNGLLSQRQVNWLKSLILKIKSKKVSGASNIEKEALKRLYDWAE
ncbi:MAG: hypothetical protein NWS49_07675 [Opitutales bacterium]|nr:hypothetical protein [Opitutales bacterium]